MGDVFARIWDGCAGVRGGDGGGPGAVFGDGPVVLRNGAGSAVFTVTNAGASPVLLWRCGHGAV